ncbi:MAG: hypothetical protein DMG90_02175 [Acidobacteria bacterium]|nr:MAG: hypothetical protein DMG90_02175 [Acidobacteriota bacterium]
MPESRKIGMVAALEREIRPLIASYNHVKRSYQDRTYSFFESDRVAAVCGGIGPEAARRATEAMIAIYKPEMVVSAGFAGGLDYTLHIGDVFCPELVIDASDGSRIEAGGRSGQLVTFGSIAGSQQKAKLANAYQAQAVAGERVPGTSGRHGSGRGGPCGGPPCHCVLRGEGNFRRSRIRDAGAGEIRWDWRGRRFQAVEFRRLRDVPALAMGPRLSAGVRQRESCARTLPSSQRTGPLCAERNRARQR